MVRPAALLLLLTTFLYACTGDFSGCRQKLADSAAFSDAYLAIPVENGMRLIYAQALPEEHDVLKADPYLGLYLVHDASPFAYPFRTGPLLLEQIAAHDAQSSTAGELSAAQIGLNELGRFSEPVATPAVLTDACCTLLGIATEHGVIERAYIDHFLKNGSRYGDAGIRVADHADGAVVVSADPYFPENPFQAGDVVVSVRGETHRGAAALMRAILFAVPGTQLQMRLQRAGNLYEVSVTVGKRHGGGRISDTYLERLGFAFDETLRLKTCGAEAAAFGLKPGDRLLQINGEQVASYAQTRMHLGRAGRQASLLFERDGFHFFVQLP